MKNRLLALLSSVGFTFLTTTIALCGETVEIEGTTYRNAEMVDVEPDGVCYKTETGDIVVLPWAKLTDAQRTTVKGRFKEGIENIVFGGHAIIGTVFQIKDGDVIIQISTEDSGKVEREYRNGAKVLKSGLVMVRNPTSTISRSLDTPVDAVAFYKGTMKFNMGFALESDIPVLTGHHPEWSLEREWKNADGKIMKSQLIAVKDGKGLFIMNGKQFVYPLDQLDAEGKAEALEFQKKIGELPYP